MLLEDGVNRPKGALITKVVGNASIGTKNAHFLVTVGEVISVLDQPTFTTVRSAGGVPS
jgi:hypothetical protein